MTISSNIYWGLIKLFPKKMRRKTLKRIWVVIAIFMILSMILWTIGAGSF